MQARIDRGEIKLRSHFEGLSEEEIKERLANMSEEAREFLLRRREELKQEKLLKEILQAEETCDNQLPPQFVEILEKIKAHLSPEYKELNSGSL